MLEQKPLLKYAVREKQENQLIYRGTTIWLSDKDTVFRKIKSKLNGVNNIKDICSICQLSESSVLDTIDYLIKQGAVTYVEGDFSELSGEKCFWLLEELLCEYRFYHKENYYLYDLEKMILQRDVCDDVVKGFFIEKAFLLRNVPSELAYSINSSFDEKVRSAYVRFFTEEYNHGEIIFKKMNKWIDSKTLLDLNPLPGTLGLLNTYRWLAHDPLYYATALIHDEGVSYDAYDPGDCMYNFVENNYENIPAEVPRVFLWHANLDRNCEHGYFPLNIFKCYERISESTLVVLKKIMVMLIELQGIFRKDICDYYSKKNYLSRSN